MITNQDNLTGQRNRIMKALRAEQAPNERDWMQAMNTYNTGQGDYFGTLKGLTDKRREQTLSTEKDIYTLMKESAESGDADAKAVQEAIDEIAGADPKLQTQLRDDLASAAHSDPEPVNKNNAKVKIMKYAAERGIVPLSVQKERVSLQKIKSDMVKAAAGGDDPAAVREYNYFKSLPESEQRKYLGVKRASPEETFEKERQKSCCFGTYRNCSQ